MRRVLDAGAQVALVALVALTFAACSSGSTSSATPDPAVVFCPALDAYGAALVKLERLDSSATVTEYKAAVTEARAALATLKAVAGPYAGAQLNDLQSAQANLESAAAGLNADDNTPAEAEAALQEDLAAVIQEVAAANNALCNFRPTPSTAP